MRQIENAIRNVAQLNECTFDESIKTIAEAACKAYCSCECSRNMAEICSMKDACNHLAWYKQVLVNQLTIDN